MDICFPNNNEDKFIEAAKSLCINSLYFVYDTLPQKNIEGHHKISEKLFCNNNTRNLFESNNKIIFFELERIAHKDKLNQRESGLNHILCNLMNKKNKIYAFSFSLLQSKDNVKQIGRLKQNAMLIQKYKVDFLLASFARHPFELKSKDSLQSFGRLIGLHPKLIKANMEKSVFYLE